MEEKRIEMPSLDTAEAVKNYILAMADAAFSPLGSRHLVPDERAIIEHGVRQLNLGLSMFKSNDPEFWNDHELRGEAVRLLMLGAFKIGSTVVSASVKKYIDHVEHSEPGKKSRQKAALLAEKWRQHVRKRTREIHHNKPFLKGTAIKNSIMDETRPAGIRLPNERDVYEVVLNELKALKQGVESKESLHLSYLNSTL